MSKVPSNEKEKGEARESHVTIKALGAVVLEKQVHHERHHSDGKHKKQGVQQSPSDLRRHVVRGLCLWKISNNNGKPRKDLKS